MIAGSSGLSAFSLVLESSAETNYKAILIVNKIQDNLIK